MKQMQASLTHILSTVILSLCITFLISPCVYSATKTCQDCHYDAEYTTGFMASVHGKNSCMSCHGDVSDTSRHMTGETKPAPVTCGRCHTTDRPGIPQELPLPPGGFPLHGLPPGHPYANGHQRRTSRSAPSRAAPSATATMSMSASGHAEAVLKGNQ